MHNYKAILNYKAITHVIVVIHTQKRTYQYTKYKYTINKNKAKLGGRARTHTKVT